MRIDRDRVLNLAKTYSHAWLFLIFAMLYLLFNLLEQYIVPKYWVFCWIDEYIPFVPAFVIPYILWFAYVGAGLVVLCLHDRQDFIRTFTLLALGMFITEVIYLFFPHGQPLRPIITDNDIFSRLVRDMIYANDTNTNCFPSLHVLNQLAVHIGLCKSRLCRDRKWFKWTSLVFSIFVCASTVFLKQHSILDVLAALILEIPLYLLVFKVNWKRLFRRRAKGQSAEYPAEPVVPQPETVRETITMD